MEITCSIIIVNWKSIDYLTKCIKSIKVQTTCPYEIIVIDNDSGKEEQTALQEIGNIHLILNDKNAGFAAANNQGFKVARGEFVFMLNPDTIILKKAIDKLIGFLENHENIFATGPKLFYSEKMDYHPSIKTFQTPFSQFYKMLPQSQRIREYFRPYDPDKTQRVDGVWGAAIMFRKQVFERIGLLDEQFFIYAEEIDFCKRMAMNNMPLYYYPEAQVIHYGGKSQKKSSEKKNKLLWTSQTKYLKKYYSRKNILFHYCLLAVLIKLKIIFLRKRELIPAYQVIWDYIKCTDSV